MRTGMRLSTEDLFYDRGDLCIVGADVCPFDDVGERIVVDPESPVMCLSCLGFMNPYCDVNCDSSWVCVLCNTHNPPIYDMESVGIVSDSDSTRNHLKQYCKELQPVGGPPSEGFVSTFATKNSDTLSVASIVGGGGVDSTITYIVAIDAALACSKDSESELRELLLPALAAMDDCSTRVLVLIVVLHEAHMSFLRLNEYCTEHRSGNRLSAPLTAYYGSPGNVSEAGGGVSTVIATDICPAISDPFAVNKYSSRGGDSCRLPNDQSHLFAQLFDQSLYAASKDDTILHFEAVLACVRSVSGQGRGTGDMLCSVSATIGLVFSVHTASSGAGMDSSRSVRLVMMVSSPPSPCVNEIRPLSHGVLGGNDAPLGDAARLQQARCEADVALSQLSDYERLGRLALERCNCFVDIFYANDAIISNTPGLQHLVQASGGLLITAERLGDPALVASFVACFGLPSCCFDCAPKSSREFSGASVRYSTSSNLRPVAFTDAHAASRQKGSIWGRGSVIGAGERLAGCKVVGGDIALCGAGISKTSSARDPAATSTALLQRLKHHLLATVGKANHASGRKSVSMEEGATNDKLMACARDCLVHWDRKLIALTGKEKKSGGTFAGAVSSLARLREELGSDDEDGEDCDVDLDPLSGSGGVGVHSGNFFQEVAQSARRGKHSSFSVLLKPRRVLSLLSGPGQEPVDDRTVSSVDEVEGGGMGPTGGSGKPVERVHESFGYIQCTASYIVRGNIEITRIFTNRVCIRYPVVSALKTNAALGERTGDCMEVGLALLLARHLVHQYASDVLLAPLLHVDYYHATSVAANKNDNRSPGLSTSLNHYIHKQTRDQYCGVVDALVMLQKVVSRAMWRSQAVDSIRFFHHLREGPLLGSAALHPSECHRQCTLFLQAFHSPRPLPQSGILTSSVALRMIEPAVYILFPDSIEPPSQKAGEDRDSADAGPGDCGRSPLNVASLLTRYPPDSIYLASEHTLGIVDMGDRVVVWVGRHYASSAANAAATALRTKTRHPDKEVRLRNSGSTKIAALLHKLYKLASHMAGVLPAFSARGLPGCDSDYPCLPRYPVARVSVITQKSPNSRLLFTRLASAHNDNKFLIQQYCDPIHYHAATRIAHQLRSDALGGMTAPLPQSESALDLFMDQVAYLPPTDTPSFMKYLSDLVPGIIQKFSKNSESLSSQEGVKLPAVPPPPKQQSSVLDIFAIFPPPPGSQKPIDKPKENIVPSGQGIAGSATELAALNCSYYVGCK